MIVANCPVIGKSLESFYLVDSQDFIMIKIIHHFKGVINSKINVQVAHQSTPSAGAEAQSRLRSDELNIIIFTNCQ